MKSVVYALGAIGVTNAYALGAIGVLRTPAEHIPAQRRHGASLHLQHGLDHVERVHRRGGHAPGDGSTES